MSRSRRLVRGVLLMAMLALAGMAIWYFFIRETQEEGDACEVDSDDEDADPHGLTYKLDEDLECKVDSCETGYSIKDGEDICTEIDLSLPGQNGGIPGYTPCTAEQVSAFDEPYLMTTEQDDNGECTIRSCGINWKPADDGKSCVFKNAGQSCSTMDMNFGKYDESGVCTEHACTWEETLEKHGGAEPEQGEYGVYAGESCDFMDCKTGYTRNAEFPACFYNDQKYVDDFVSLLNDKIYELQSFETQLTNDAMYMTDAKIEELKRDFDNTFFPNDMKNKIGDRHDEIVDNSKVDHSKLTGPYQEYLKMKDWSYFEEIITTARSGIVPVEGVSCPSYFDSRTNTVSGANNLEDCKNSIDGPNVQFATFTKTSVTGSGSGTCNTGYLFDEDEIDTDVHATCLISPELAVLRSNYKDNPLCGSSYFTFQTTPTKSSIFLDSGYPYAVKLNLRSCFPDTTNPTQQIMAYIEFSYETNGDNPRKISYGLSDQFSSQMFNRTYVINSRGNKISPFRNGSELTLCNLVLGMVLNGKYIVRKETINLLEPDSRYFSKNDIFYFYMPPAYSYYYLNSNEFMNFQRDMFVQGSSGMENVFKFFKNDEIITVRCHPISEGRTITNRKAIPSVLQKTSTRMSFAVREHHAYQGTSRKNRTTVFYTDGSWISMDPDLTSVQAKGDNSIEFFDSIRVGSVRPKAAVCISWGSPVMNNMIFFLDNYMIVWSRGYFDPESYNLSEVFGSQPDFKYYKKYSVVYSNSDRDRIYFITKDDTTGYMIYYLQCSAFALAATSKQTYDMYITGALKDIVFRKFNIYGHRKQFLPDYGNITLAEIDI